MSSETRFLCKLIGLYCIIAALSMAAHRRSSIETVTALLDDRPAMLLLGFITVALGLTLVLAHNVWSGGAPTIVVTLIGWITLAKGLLFWFAPGAAADLYLRQLHYAQLFYLYTAISFVIGAYLTGAGFSTRARAQP